MPCLLVLIAFFFPRAVIILLALFTNFLSHAYTGLLIPILGFCFLPYTTLAYAWAKNTHGSVEGVHLFVVVVAVLVDLGVVGGSERARRVRVMRARPRD